MRLRQFRCHHTKKVGTRDNDWHGGMPANGHSNVAVGIAFGNDRVFKHQHGDERRAGRNSTVMCGCEKAQRTVAVVEQLKLGQQSKLSLDKLAAPRQRLDVTKHRLGQVLDNVVHDIFSLALYS